ncbi:MAG: hypothetical protein AAFP89_06105 [Bacteroidota bacterium]
MYRYYVTWVLSLWWVGLGASHASRVEAVWNLTPVDTPWHAENHEVWIDHERHEVVIRAWYFAAHNHPKAWEQLEFALSFWNSQSREFALQIDSQGTHTSYPIRFELEIPQGRYTEDGFYIPTQLVSAQFITQVEVIPAARMPIKRTSQLPVAGYAPSNFIYISSLHTDNKWIGPHEVGHRLGADHVPATIMDEDLEGITYRVNKRIIKSIVETQVPVLWEQKGWRIIRL